ncbi:MAG: glycosyltransferase family 4 protein [Caldimicrobium sp.]|nr:glycosyltransferase family 4 protein [Caldimicrobium sp.]
MKILSILSPVKFGGGERFLLDQAKVFREKGIEYVIVCLNRSSEFEKFLNQENIKYFNLTDIEFKQTPTKKEYLFLFFKLLPKTFKLKKLIQKEKPDILLSNGFPAVFLVPLSVLFLKTKPKIFYVHHFQKQKENFLTRKIYLWFLKKYEKIIAVSSATADSLKAVFPEIKEEILAIPNGIDTERFEIKETKEELRKKLNLPDGVLGICVGRLTPFKNQKFLIKVAKKIKKDDFYILIIGDGDEYENLKREIEKQKLENRVKLLGFIPSDEIPYYLKASDIFLYPSLKEGFGIVVLEAMAVGLPVVIFKEIYTEEFGSNILVANNEEKFVSYVGQLVENKSFREELGSKLKQDALKLDIRKVAEIYLEVFGNE